MAHRIQNFEALAENELRRDALSIAEAGYQAVDVATALRKTLEARNSTFVGRRIFFVGIGKCAFAAAPIIESFFGETLVGGIALDVAAPPQNLAKIEVIRGSHPLPSEINIEATRRILDFLSGHNENDCVVVMVSGGGSVLLCQPQAPMTANDEATLFNALTAGGASIQELNTVRKHMSRARGGGLAAAAYPAEVVSLIVSDVPGNDIEYIASGPTALDSSTIADARTILARYDSTAMNVALLETPKEQKYFDRVTNILFLTSQNALSAMAKEAEARGYHAEIVDEHITGEAREVGRAVVEKLHAAEAKSAYLYAGESTVALGSGYGAGGRNQEMALAALDDVRDDELMLPFASDGHDNTDHAGAIADADTFVHAQEKNISTADYLAAHRSYDFFTVTNDALITGYTGSNVSDLVIALKK